jgi:hypothetical protein
MWFVDEALCYASMITVYTISAKLEHYTSMVNLLGSLAVYRRPRI